MRRSATRAKPAPTRVAAPVAARPRFPVWLMAGLLVLVTIAIYWPATRYDFVNFDDQVYVTANAHVQKRADLGKREMGFLEPCELQLASLNGVVPHAGLPTVRFEPLGTSLDQRAAARPQRGAGLRVAATDDGRDVAEFVGGGAVRAFTRCTSNRWPGCRNARMCSAASSVCSR